MFCTGLVLELLIASSTLTTPLVDELAIGMFTALSVTVSAVPSILTDSSTFTCAPAATPVSFSLSAADIRPADPPVPPVEATAVALGIVTV